MIDFFGREAKREIEALRHELASVKDQRDYWMARARELELGGRYARDRISSLEARLLAERPRLIAGTPAYQMRTIQLAGLDVPSEEWLAESRLRQRQATVDEQAPGYITSFPAANSD